MSFSPSNTTKAGENNLGGINNQAVNQQLPMFNQQGGNLMNIGQQNVSSGTNFLNTLLAGNKANTTAALQPQLNDITGAHQNTLNSISTLMPRGGGRSSGLFNESFAPQQQMQNLFNTSRLEAASALPQIGLQQQGLGGNLYGLGNQALGIGSGASSNLAQLGQTDRAASNKMAMGIGSGILGLATMPFGGGAATNGLLGLL